MWTCINILGARTPFSPFNAFQDQPSPNAMKRLIDANAQELAEWVQNVPGLAFIVKSTEFHELLLLFAL